MTAGTSQLGTQLMTRLLLSSLIVESDARISDTTLHQIFMMLFYSGRELKNMDFRMDAGGPRFPMYVLK